MLSAELQDVTEVRASLQERRHRSLQSRSSSLQNEIALLKSQNRMLKKLIFTDPLTGLCNRMALERTLIPRWSSYPKGTVIIFDLDKFKSVNDQHGHQAGDRVLQCFGEIVRANIRSEDLAVRYGGEEFVVLVQNSLADEAAFVGERIRKATERYSFPGNLKLTVSGGIAAGDPVWDALFPRADQALYRAKGAGRNTIIVAQNDKH